MKNRNANGTFAAGCAGGPGRPARRIEERYLDALKEVVSVDDWKAIAERAKRDALKGNDKARRWLSTWLLGDARQLRLSIAREGEAQPLTIFDIVQAVEENRKVPVIGDREIEAMCQALPDRTDVEAVESNGDGG